MTFACRRSDPGVPRFEGWRSAERWEPLRSSRLPSQWPPCSAGGGPQLGLRCCRRGARVWRLLLCLERWNFQRAGPTPRVTVTSFLISPRTATRRHRAAGARSAAAGAVCCGRLAWPLTETAALDRQSGPEWRLRNSEGEPEHSGCESRRHRERPPPLGGSIENEAHGPERGGVEGGVDGHEPGEREVEDLEDDLGRGLVAQEAGLRHLRLDLGLQGGEPAQREARDSTALLVRGWARERDSRNYAWQQRLRPRPTLGSAARIAGRLPTGRLAGGRAPKFSRGDRHPVRDRGRERGPACRGVGSQCDIEPHEP